MGGVYINVWCPPAVAAEHGRIPFGCVGKNVVEETNGLDNNRAPEELECAKGVGHVAKGPF